jgi:hypothetical protein
MSLVVLKRSKKWDNDFGTTFKHIIIILHGNQGTCYICIKLSIRTTVPLCNEIIQNLAAKTEPPQPLTLYSLHYAHTHTIHHPCQSSFQKCAASTDTSPATPQQKKIKMNTLTGNLMFCWRCITVHQYSKTNKMHILYSVYYELTATTCFKHYLLIFGRHCTNNSYTHCVSCQLVATSSTPNLVTTNRHNMHTIYKLLFVERLLKMSR